MKALVESNCSFPAQTGIYRGKVRDVYEIAGKYLVMIVTDRISAFDVILPKGIPYKGQVLNQLAARLMKDTDHIVPNWIIDVPHPNVTIGKKCVPYKVEMVIRGYLSGHAWREYRDGKRMICGEIMPDGMRENDPFPEPIITPSTKAESGHDQDISAEQIVKQKLVPEKEYLQLAACTRALFKHGTEMAAKQGLILVDTKYEFGKDQNGNIILIDEIHTPDSSRYFYSDGYEERQRKAEKQRQLSKEFVREWLIEHGFRGLEGQQIPEMNDTFIRSVSDRYIELFEQLSGQPFIRQEYAHFEKEMENKVKRSLETLL